MSDKKPTIETTKKALFPGSFSPFHNGHLIILREMLNYYTNANITILVANNPSKVTKNVVSLELRKELIEKVLDNNNIKNINVDILKKGEITPDYYFKNNFDIIVRGSRDIERNFRNYNFNVPSDEGNLMSSYQEYNPEINFHYIVFQDETSSELIIKNFDTNKSNHELVDESVYEMVKKL